MAFQVWQDKDGKQYNVEIKSCEFNCTDYKFPVIVNANENSEVVLIQLLNMYEEYANFINIVIGERRSLEECPFCSIIRTNIVSIAFINYLSDCGFSKFAPDDNVLSMTDISPFNVRPICEYIANNIKEKASEIKGFLLDRGVRRVTLDETADTDW